MFDNANLMALPQSIKEAIGDSVSNVYKRVGCLLPFDADRLLHARLYLCDRLQLDLRDLIVFLPGGV